MVELWLGIAVLGGGATFLAWTALLTRIYRVLRETHSQLYREVGSPSARLAWNETILTNGRFVGFLIAGDWRELRDVELSRRCRIARVVLLAHLASLLMFIIGLYWAVAR